LRVAGIAHVTAGCETSHFSTKAAQVCTPSSSRAHVGRGAAGEPAQRGAAVERAVDDHRDTAVDRQRQQRLGAAVGGVVGDLQHVERLAAQQPCDLVVAAAVRRRDADQPHPARLACRAQRLQVRIGGQQVVHLHQVHARHAPQPQRVGELGAARGFEWRPDLARRDHARGERRELGGG